MVTNHEQLTSADPWLDSLCSQGADIQCVADPFKNSLFVQGPDATSRNLEVKALTRKDNLSYQVQTRPLERLSVVTNHSQQTSADPCQDSLFLQGADMTSKKTVGDNGPLSADLRRLLPRESVLR